MELMKRGVIGESDAAPNGRFNVREAHLNLENGPLSAHSVEYHTDKN
jgi:hypothetical protein